NRHVEPVVLGQLDDAAGDLQDVFVVEGHADRIEPRALMDRDGKILVIDVVQHVGARHVAARTGRLVAAATARYEQAGDEEQRAGAGGVTGTREGSDTHGGAWRDGVAGARPSGRGIRLIVRIEGNGCAAGWSWPPDHA